MVENTATKLTLHKLRVCIELAKNIIAPEDTNVYEIAQRKGKGLYQLLYNDTIGKRYCEEYGYSTFTIDPLESDPTTFNFTFTKK